jgi:hypothetical protein
VYSRERVVERRERIAAGRWRAPRPHERPCSCGGRGRGRAGGRELLVHGVLGGLVARLARCEWRCRVGVGLPGAGCGPCCWKCSRAAALRPRLGAASLAQVGCPRLEKEGPRLGWCRVGLASDNFRQGRSGSLGFTGRVPAGPGSTKPDQLRPQQSRIASARSPASPDSPIIPRVRRRLTPRARASRSHPTLLDAAYAPAPPLRVLPPRAPFLPKRAQAAGNERRPLARGSRGSCIRFGAIARAAG